MKELIFNSLLWEAVVALKYWFLAFSTLEGCGGLETTDFQQFLIWECVVVLKELIFNSFSFGKVWWFWKTWFLAVSTLGGCGGLERSDFLHVFSWTRFRFLLKQEIFCVEVKFSPVIQHGFLRTAENVYVHNFLVVFGKKFFP